MRIFIAGLCLCALAFSGSAAVQASDADPVSAVMKEVTVKGDPLKSSLTVPTPASARAELNRVPGGTALVESEDYKKGRSSTLQDALGYSAGIFVQPRFGSEEARLSIRGSGLQRTFHLRGIKLLQDGIPINQADGGGDFQSIEPLALQHIEAYRGANALQYGSTTLGGAVNFVTPTGYDAPLVQGRFEVGSYNYLRDQISSGAVGGPFDYFVSLSEFRQDGFRNHSDQWARRMNSNYGIRLGEDAETRIYVNLVDTKSKLPGNLTKAQMRQNPARNAAANVTGNQKRDFDQVQLANKTMIQLDEQTLEFGFFYMRKDLFHPIFQVLDVLYHDIGGMIRYTNTADLFNRRNIFRFGFNPVWGIVEDIRHVNTGGNRGARTAQSKQNSYNLDFYAENQFYVLDRLAAVAGLQWTLASRKTRDKFLSDGNHSGHPTYVGVSPKVGLLYDLTERSQAFINYSRSFEPPSFGELSNVTGGGIRNLNEQTAHTLEVGTRGEEGRFSWDLAWYYSWVENELLSLNDGAGNPLGTVNAYGTRHQGVEFGLSVDLLRGILSREESGRPLEARQKPEDFHVSDLLGLRERKAGEDRIFVRGVYNWSRFRFSDDPAFSDNPLPGIPEHFLRAELVYEHPGGFYFGPNLEWTFRKYPVDMANTLFADSYAILGVKGGYRTKNGLSFFVEGRNLTDETYAATTGVINNANGADSAQFLPGDGRGVYSGVEFRWG